MSTGHRSREAPPQSKFAVVLPPGQKVAPQVLPTGAVCAQVIMQPKTNPTRTQSYERIIHEEDKYEDGEVDGEVGIFGQPSVS